MDLYLWRGDDFPLKKCRKAARPAFGYLREAGYHESLWKNCGPKDPGLDAVVLTLREQADKALTMLERDFGMGDHDKIETGLPGLGKTYRTLKLELERIIPAK